MPEKIGAAGILMMRPSNSVVAHEAVLNSAAFEKEYRIQIPERFTLRAMPGPRDGLQRARQAARQPPHLRPGLPWRKLPSSPV